MTQVTADQADIGSWYYSERGKEVKVLDRANDGRTRVYSHWARAATIVPPHYVLDGPIEPPADSEDGFTFTAPSDARAVPPPPPPPHPSELVQPSPPSTVDPSPAAAPAEPSLLPAGTDIADAPGLRAAILAVLGDGRRKTRNQVYDLLAPLVAPEGRDLLQSRISTSLASLVLRGLVDTDGNTFGGVPPSDG